VLPLYGETKIFTVSINDISIPTHH